MKYDQLYDGKWVSPIKKGYRIKCCDCGLVHILDFKTVKTGRGTSVLFRARRASGSGRK